MRRSLIRPTPTKRPTRLPTAVCTPMDAGPERDQPHQTAAGVLAARPAAAGRACLPRAWLPRRRRSEIAPLVVDRRRRGGAVGCRAVVALILANGTNKTQTAVPPLPAMPGPSAKARRLRPSTRTSPRHRPSCRRRRLAARAAPRDPGRDAKRPLQRHRRGSRDQHHLLGYRRRHPDRIQCFAALEQTGQPVPVGRSSGQRHDHQHRSQRHLHGHCRWGSDARTRRAPASPSATPPDAKTVRRLRPAAAGHGPPASRAARRSAPAISRPARRESAPKTSTNTENSQGATNATARPVIV